MNILVPMSGEGKAFLSKYIFPKALVEIDGKPMIQVVVENLRFSQPHRFIFLIRKEDAVRFHLESVLNLVADHPRMIHVDRPTAGAACTALLAIDDINNDEPLLVANADQKIDAHIEEICQDFLNRGLDGGIITFESLHPRWSYVRMDEEGLVVEAAEKHPISRHATAGIYFFRHGKDFVQSVMEMVKKQVMVDGQYYICPAYNQMVLHSKKIGVFALKKGQFHPLGTPENVLEYEAYLKNKKSEGK